ncbi:hypothetical protein VTN49DRAFT_5867 [Thermomyces lanuginosus]|uniref:uncharacterized protein n=1 Tax=Thermomyces lanuginosus TaxID=5541 RepID=UPI0037428930
MFCSMYDIVIPASPVRPLGIGPAWYLLRAWLPMTDLFSSDGVCVFGTHFGLTIGLGYFIIRARWFTSVGRAWL